MLELFSDENRRNPFPLYRQLRESSPLLYDPQSKLWFVFDFANVKRVLTDHETFSSRLGPADWMIFLDPPRHTKLRALIAKAFTPASINRLEGRIAQICRELLDPLMPRDEFDVASELAIPLPMIVIAEMLGVPASDRPKFIPWNDAILKMSLTIPGGPRASNATEEFFAVTAQMSVYLDEQLERRRAEPRDDLLTRLLQAEMDGQRLTPREILDFFQPLLVAGSETTTNLINNAILCFMDFPQQLAKLRETPALLPAAIEEVLRFRSPLQWMFRATTRDVEIHGQTVPAGRVVIALIGSANHDPNQFAEPERFDIMRDPNPHIAFGHGAHFCMGAPLARLEARVALTEFLSRWKSFRPAGSEPWQPRAGLHVYGPQRLPVRVE